MLTFSRNGKGIDGDQTLKTNTFHLELKLPKNPLLPAWPPHTWMQTGTLDGICVSFPCSILSVASAAEHLCLSTIEFAQEKYLETEEES